MHWSDTSLLYIDFLENQDTDLIVNNLLTVLQHLFDNYGKVPRLFKENEQEVLPTPFVPSDPMVSIFLPIKQLKTFAKIAKISEATNDKKLDGSKLSVNDTPFNP